MSGLHEEEDWTGGGWLFEDDAKYSKLLSLYHRIISDPYRSPSDILSDVLCKIILSPVLIDDFLIKKVCILSFPSLPSIY